MVYLHDTICRIPLFARRMQCCPKRTDPAYDLFANVAVGPDEVIDLIAYITTNNRTRQSYRVDWALDMQILTYNLNL